MLQKVIIEEKFATCFKGSLSLIQDVKSDMTCQMDELTCEIRASLTGYVKSGDVKLF